MTVNQMIFLKTEEFYEKLQNGEFDHPLTLARELQKLADQAWLQVEELYLCGSHQFLS